MNYLKNLWNSMPHRLQGGLVAFGSAASAGLIDALTGSDALCFSVNCLKHYGSTALVGGLVALKAFYMKPNKEETVKQ